MLPRNCEICSGHFIDPKVLPCFHIVCRDCVRSLQVKGRDELRCPINQCSKRFKCENTDPESLPDALTVYHFQDLAKFRKKLQRNEISCDTCFEGEHKEVTAVASCSRCNFICEKCAELHSKLTEKYLMHDVLCFSDLSRSEEEEEECHLEILKRSRFHQKALRKCKIHPREICNSYCLDCKALVCSCCTGSDHSGHRCDHSMNAVKECRSNLSEHVQSIKLTKRRLLGAVEVIKHERTLIEDQRKTLSSTMDSTFDRLVDILQKRRKQLQSQLTELTSRKIHKLAAQQIEVENSASEIERMGTFTEKTLTTSTNSELLKIYSFLYGSVKESLEVSSEDNLKPIERANTAFKSSARKEMTELCQKSLMVYSRQASPSACTVVEDVGFKSVETMKYSQFRINVVDKKRRPCQSVQDVAVKIKCCENGFESKALVHDTSMSQYRVSFCPEFKGRHEIDITVNGQGIRGSPFPMKVRMPHSQLGTPQGSIVDMMHPRGIILTPDDKILVCEWNGKRIIKIDKLGRQVSSFVMESLFHPASVALHSSSKYLFVVEGSGSNGGVIKCSGDGKILKSVQGDGTEPRQFKNPRGIKISSKNEVFVCDRDNNRIQVYDLDLNFLRIIEFQNLNSHLINMPQPNDLVFDQRANFYVTDYSNHCIHKFNLEEEYESTFSQTKEGQLAGPECITVDDFNYLYVTESHGHRVSVFHTSGECVASFGSKGRNEGEFNFPMGIAVDSVGNVYVCELWNNRIQVF